MPHAALTIWVVAAAGGALYALLTRLRQMSARSGGGAVSLGVGRHRRRWRRPQVCSLVNTTSEPFSRVGASARWPGVWIGTAVSPCGRPALGGSPPQDSRAGRLRGVRNAVSMTTRRSASDHRRGVDGPARRRHAMSSSRPTPPTRPTPIAAGSRRSHHPVVRGRRRGRGRRGRSGRPRPVRRQPCGATPVDLDSHDQDDPHDAADEAGVRHRWRPAGRQRRPRPRRAG